MRPMLPASIRVPGCSQLHAPEIGDRPKLAITRYVGRVVHVAVGVLYPDMDAMTLGTD